MVDQRGFRTYIPIKGTIGTSARPWNIIFNITERKKRLAFTLGFVRAIGFYRYPRIARGGSNSFRSSYRFPSRFATVIGFVPYYTRAI